MTTDIELTVDAHVHLWNLSVRTQPWIDPVTMAAINRDFHPEELQATMIAADVDRAVLVQVLNRRDETHDLIRQAHSSPVIESVVGWIDLTRPDIGEQLEQRDPLLVGIRHQALAEPDPPAWFMRQDVQRGLSALGRHQMPFDVMLHWHQLPSALEMFDGKPEVEVIIDHAGKPPIADGIAGPNYQDWRRVMRLCAQRERLWCKLSGLTTMAAERWTVEDLYPFINDILDIYGPYRVLFGSDWPVSSRRGPYRELVEAIRSAVSTLSPTERAAIMGGNALRLYSVHHG